MANGIGMFTDTGGGGAWVPTDIGGCVLWLRSDLGITKDGSDRVSLWADQSGNGNDLLQATDTKKFLWQTNQINGNPALLSDNIDDFMATANDPAMDHNGSYTLFLHCAIVTYEGDDVIIRKYTDSPQFDFMQGAVGGTWRMTHYYDNYYWGDAISQLTTFCKYRVKPVWNGVDTTTVYFHRNGTGVGSANISAQLVNNTNPFYIGCFWGLYSFSNLNIREVIIYNADLTDEQSAQVENYMT